MIQSEGSWVGFGVLDDSANLGAYIRLTIHMATSGSAPGIPLGDEAATFLIAKPAEPLINPGRDLRFITASPKSVIDSQVGKAYPGNIHIAS
jgi:hypothetical protein